MPTQRFETFLAGVRRGQVPPAVYLHGSEDVLKEEAVSEIVTRLLDPSVKDFNLDQRSATNLDAEDAETLCFSLPMLADRRVAIIRDVEAWTKRAKAKSTVLKFLDRPANQTALILLQGSGAQELDPDLVSRATSVAAEPLSPEDAKKWAIHHIDRLGIKLEPKAVDHLIDATDAKLGILRAELEKLSGLEQREPLSVRQVADLIGISHGETQYDWRDAVLEGRTVDAVRLLPHVLGQSGVSGVSLVSLLGTSLIGIGFARSMSDGGKRGGTLNNVVKDMLFRLRPAGRINYVAAAAQWSRLAASWPPARIERALKALRRADERLKQTVFSDEEAILFDAIMEATAQ